MKPPEHADPPRQRMANLVLPQLSGEVAYSNKHADGRLRYPELQGIRDDRTTIAIPDATRPASRRQGGPVKSSARSAK